MPFCAFSASSTAAAVATRNCYYNTDEYRHKTLIVVSSTVAI